MIRFRPMTEDDLPAVAAWLEQPHVARWWTADTTAEAELAEYRQRVSAAADGAAQATEPGDSPMAIYRLPASEITT